MEHIKGSLDKGITDRLLPRDLIADSSNGYHFQRL